MTITTTTATSFIQMGQHQDKLTTSNLDKITQEKKKQQQLMRINENLNENEPSTNIIKRPADVAPTFTSASLQANRAPFKAELVWMNMILFAILHSSLPIGLYLIYTQRPWKTLVFSIGASYAAFLGVTGGSHRLWSHRAYRAKWPIQVLLCLLQTMAGQNSIYTWARDHRMHHKYEETDADPHNIKRGLLFAHMGWLCCRKHPELREKGKSIDMSDLEANPYVMFQHRHFWLMALVFTVLVPTMLPVLLWAEHFWTSFVLAFMIRYLLTLHSTWLVNSVAHYYGNRPYDNRIEARNSPLAICLALGEGFHNYHHTFPYDYAASEFGRHMNITTAFIDLCASLGLVHGRRKVDVGSILRRRARTGDLSEIKGKIEMKQQAALWDLMATKDTTNNSILESGDGSQKLIIDERKEQQGAQVIKSSFPATAAGSNLIGDRMMVNHSTLSDNSIYDLRHISGLTNIQCTPCA